MQRKTPLCLLALLLVCGMLLGGCKKTETQPDEPQATPAATAALHERLQPMGQREQRQVAPASDTLVGFVAPQNREFALQMALHGFLRTAETLGYPAKVYYAAMGGAAEAAVQQAAEDGCKGLLVWNPGGGNDRAIAQAGALSIPVIVPYYASEGTGVSANVAADLLGYSEEVALCLAQRMVERECKAGKILIFGYSPQGAYEVFRQAIAAYYPQYNVGHLVRTGLTEQAAIDELAEHILWNRDIKGLFATDLDGAKIAVQARKKAEAEFKANGAPEGTPATPKPGATPAAGATPTPAGGISIAPAEPATPTEGTPATPSAGGPAGMPAATPVPEGLLKSIIITVAGYGLNEDAIALFEKNDIYACVAEPYYEAGAQSLMLLDKLLHGESVPAQMRLNMPIVRTATLDKYVLIQNQVRDFFAE